MQILVNMDDDQYMFFIGLEDCQIGYKIGKELHHLLKNGRVLPEKHEIIKALEQKSVLDKIRAEIKALSPEPTAYDVVDGNPVKDAIWETLIEVDKIIDKYKAESEE